MSSIVNFSRCPRSFVIGSLRLVFLLTLLSSFWLFQLLLSTIDPKSEAFGGRLKVSFPLNTASESDRDIRTSHNTSSHPSRISLSGVHGNRRSHFRVGDNTTFCKAEVPTSHFLKSFFPTMVKPTFASRSTTEYIRTSDSLYNPDKMDLSVFLDGPGLDEKGKNNNSQSNAHNDIFNSFDQKIINSTYPEKSHDFQLLQWSRFFKSHVAVCSFKLIPLSQRLPHAMQQIIRCMSYWRAKQSPTLQDISQQSNSDEEFHAQPLGLVVPVLVVPSYRFHSFYSEASSQKLRRTECNPTNFICCLLKELVQLFNVVVTVRDQMAFDVYDELWKIQQHQLHQQSLHHPSFVPTYNSNNSTITESSEESTPKTMSVDTMLTMHLLASPNSTTSLALRTVLRDVLLKECMVETKMDNPKLTAFAVHDRIHDIPYYTNLIKARYDLLKHKNYDAQTNETHQDPNNQRDNDVHPYHLQRPHQNYSPIPRIGIVNRHKSKHRTILNVHKLANAIQDLLNYEIHTDGDGSGVSDVVTQQMNNLKENQTSTLLHVPIVYFENATFLEQVQFYSSVDIVIAPHGAQLTGLLFLPTLTSLTTSNNTTYRCSVVFEMFPSGYYLPWYFGLLAASSNVQHYSIYVSNHKEIGTDYYNLTRLEQGRGRKRNLCPQVSSIVAAVRTLVRDWQRCNHRTYRQR